MYRSRQWIEEAACAGAPLEWFHPDRGPGAPAAIRRAKAICAQCPVDKKCLEYAMATEAPAYRHGVWGGLSAFEREVLFDGRREVPRCRNGHSLVDAPRNEKGRRVCVLCREARERSRPTHCRHGHPWTPENRVPGSRGGTACRECSREAVRRYRKAKRCARG